MSNRGDNDRRSGNQDHAVVTRYGRAVRARELALCLSYKIVPYQIPDDARMFYLITGGQEPYVVNPSPRDEEDVCSCPAWSMYEGVVCKHTCAVLLKLRDPEVVTKFREWRANTRHAIAGGQRPSP